MSAADVQFFFQIRDQVKLYHWQTKMYPRHKATDDAISALDESIDKYVEVYMGKYGRPHITTRTGVVHVKNLSEKQMVKFIRNVIQYLIEELPKGLKKTDTDLMNIRDEMLAEMNQLLYLFTLH